jgi:glycerophosphoryl diester phosphodiesterase
MLRPLFLLLFCASALTSSALEIIAHRGASADAPENTLAAFRLAWEQQTDTCELDIHQSKDGHVMVMHDANTQRTTGLDQKISALTLEELRSLDAGSWKGPQWKGEKIPRLAEALATMPDGKRFFIEIKCGPEVLPALKRVLAESGKKPAQLVIIGFDYGTVERAKKLMPEIEVYWLASPRKGTTLDTLVDRAKAAQLDGLFLQSTFPITPDFVSKIKAAGLRLFVWTVNDTALGQRLAEAGVEGIGTDVPQLMRRVLSAQ